MIQRNPHIYFGPSELHGRGVFTTEMIEEGSIIEICPVLIVPQKDVNSIHNTSLHDYYFLWGAQEKKAAILLGFGSLYNHSFTPNAEFKPDFEMETMSLFCIKEIPAGAEIFINYLGDELAKKQLWFDIK